MAAVERDETSRTAEHVARESDGRLVAYLSARTLDVASAEDALAEGFAAALRTWPVDGVPAHPDAWLLTVARHRLTDGVRRRQTQAAGEELVADEIDTAAAADDEIPDRRLALMFTCAHPAIDRGMRAPLIIQTILGLTAADIAAAFLVPPGTMGQRLVGPSSASRTPAFPSASPRASELPERLDAGGAGARVPVACPPGARGRRGSRTAPGESGAARRRDSGRRTAVQAARRVA